MSESQESNDQWSSRVVEIDGWVVVELRISVGAAKDISPARRILSLDAVSSATKGVGYEALAPIEQLYYENPREVADKIVLEKVRAKRGHDGSVLYPDVT